MKKKSISLLVVFLSGINLIIAQDTSPGTVKLDLQKIYSLCLDANVKPALALLEYDTSKQISARDSKIKEDLESRFKFDEDKSNYIDENKSDIKDLLQIFQNYWRKSLLNSENNIDSLLIDQVKDFITKTYSITKNKLTSEDSLDDYLKKYIQEKNLHTTGFGKTGKLYDLLVWRNEKDTVYSFTIHEEKISSRVFMMTNFITLGWEEYATLGRFYPGGWTTKEALYCVEKAYDLNSETFTISYLAHESRHFADYKLFPNLKSADLEYRAKLTELSMAKETLYNLIKFFINNSNYSSDNGHSVANYCVIRDLSKELFKSEPEKDISKWRTIDVDEINKAAYKVLQSNTKSLQEIGPSVEKYIKK